MADALEPTEDTMVLQGSVAREHAADLRALLAERDALTAEVAALREDRARLDALDSGCWQLDYDDDMRTVDQIHGGVNDRQWTEVGRGMDLRAAIDAARRGP